MPGGGAGLSLNKIQPPTASTPPVNARNECFQTASIPRFSTHSAAVDPPTISVGPKTTPAYAQTVHLEAAASWYISAEPVFVGSSQHHVEDATASESSAAACTLLAPPPAPPISPSSSGSTEHKAPSRASGTYSLPESSFAPASAPTRSPSILDILAAHPSSLKPPPNNRPNPFPNRPPAPSQINISVDPIPALSSTSRPTPGTLSPASLGGQPSTISTITRGPIPLPTRNSPSPVLPAPNSVDSGDAPILAANVKLFDSLCSTQAVTPTGPSTPAERLNTNECARGSTHTLLSGPPSISQQHDQPVHDEREPSSFLSVELALSDLPGSSLLASLEENLRYE